MKNTCTKILILAFALLATVQSFAINQIDGNWEEYGLTSEYDGYYVIATAEDLEDFRRMWTYNGTYNGVVIADITVNESVLDENGELRSDWETTVTKRWGSASAYSGTFDGRNHTISGLYITYGGYYTGLFCQVMDGTIIKNVKIDDSYYQGKDCVGGICASRNLNSDEIVISNCSVNAYIKATLERAGGIYGGYISKGRIENCENSGIVISEGSTSGGICASWEGEIIHCSNKGTVMGNGEFVGGIVGDGWLYENTMYASSISECSNTGTISGHQYVGGIAGRGSAINNSCNTGQIMGVTYVGGIGGLVSTMENVFNTGTITANSGYVGGLSGSAKNISYSYNAGRISNNSSLDNVGGLTGKCTGAITNCYYDSDVCPFKAVNNDTNSGATSKTTEEMCSSTLLSGFESEVWRAGTTNELGDIIPIDDEFAYAVNGRYPSLKNVDVTPYAMLQYYNTATTELPNWETFIPIYSVEDLAKIEDNPTATVVLMNDIIEYRNMLDGNLLETPIVSWTPISLFKGKLYGRGNIISGLCMTNSTNLKGGLFAEIEDATIKGITISNCIFKSTMAVGGIAGYVSGNTSITYCNNYCNIDVSPDNFGYAGGICGRCSSEGEITIQKCNNYGNIKATEKSYAGGILGDINTPYLNVIECTNSGNIIGSEYTGGIIGYAYSGGNRNTAFVNQCLNKGTISANVGDVGGIVGHIQVYVALKYCLNIGEIINLGGGYTGGIAGSENAGGSIHQSLNLGEVQSVAKASAICNQGTMNYNYYDSDVCLFKAIVNEDNSSNYGMTTSELINGNLPSGFSSEYWAIRPAEIRDMKKYYYYPYIKCYGQDSAILAIVRDCHSVTMNFNGGTTTDDIISFYVETEKAQLPHNVVKDGCTFAGWYDNSNYTSSPFTEVPLTETQPKTFYAKWIANNYGITYELGGGTINSGKNTSYTYGYGVLLPTDVTRVGFTFGGWFDNKECVGESILSIAPNEVGNKIFYAKWTKITYTITLNANNGSINEIYPTEYNYGDEVTLPVPTREGYTFAGWYNNSNLTGTEFTKISPTETGNKEFWAKWNVNTYSVTLITNDGVINSGNITNYVYGNVALLPADVTKTGCTFNGWYDNENFDGDAITTIVNNEVGDKTYYAKFTVNTYNVILVTNEGVINAGNVESYEFGKGATLPTDVTKTGYTFDGWFSNSSYIGGSVSSIANNDMGDKQFWAKWTINEYEVTATAENGSVEGTGSYEYKSTVTMKAIANEGYEFVGWNDNEVTDARIQFVVTKDTTLTANFKEKEKVQIAGTLEIPTLKTEREAQPIDLAGLFTTTEGGEVTYSATSSAPNVVAATVSEGKLFLTVYEYEGEAEITVTATLPNGEKNSVKATATVVLACNIQVEETITNVSCFGESDGEIALKVTNAAEPYTTLWTGDATEDTLRNVTAGNYTVNITDNEGCTFSKAYVVSQPAEMTMKATIKNPTCENADGSILIDLTGVENASFAWSNEATTQNIASLKKGDYSVVITNTETGCQVSDSYTLVEPEAPVISVATTVATACDKADGAVYITANSDDLIYMWSNSKTTKDLVGVRAGDYTLEVVDNKNCKASLNVTVPSIQLKQPEIALVTVSQESGKNLVVWLKENTDLIDYYTIYRVDTAKNKYDKVVDVPYSELSVYEDLAANPMERAWKYKMSATDVCGNETAMSDYHSSLHLMKIKSLGVENHLAWDPYEGIDFDSYVILRKTKVKGVVEIDTLAMIPSDLTSYTDTLPARGTTSYYVGVKLPETINPKTQFLKAESGPFALALSNIAEAENVAVKNIVFSADVKVYPTKFNSYLNVAIAAPYEANYRVEIWNVSGQVVLQTQTDEISNTLLQIPTETLKQGVYTVKIFDGKQVKSFKVVK